MQDWPADPRLAAAAALDAFLAAPTAPRLVRAGGGGAPELGATITGTPRLVLTLSGRNRMRLPLRDGVRECTLRAGEAVGIAAQAWNHHLPRHPHSFLTVDFQQRHVRYYLREMRHGDRHPDDRVRAHYRPAPTGPVGAHLLHALGELRDHDEHLPLAGSIARALLHNARRELDDHSDEQERSAASWRRCCEWLEEHLAEELGRDDCARAVGLHPNHVSRLFRQHGDECFAAHLTRLRMQRAESLLRRYPLGVAEVARRCGYRDPGYFARVFRRHAGTSPVRYRAEAAS